MFGRNELLEDLESKFKEIKMTSIVWEAVNFLRANPHQKMVKIISDDFYLARMVDFQCEMGVGYRQIVVDGEIYVIGKYKWFHCDRKGGSNDGKLCYFKEIVEKYH